MVNTQRKNWIYYGLVIILAFILIFLHFYKLEVDSVKNWDESIYGVNGLEMLKTGELIINTYGYKPDYFNLKPILWPFLVMLGFRLFGQNLIGLRIFSALCMMLCICLCAFFAYRKSGKKSLLFVLLCFAANRHLLLYHCARSGDADSLYVLICTGAFLALADTEKGKKRLYICSLCFSLAFLAKSLHAGVIASVILVYLFSTGEYKDYGFKDYAICTAISGLPVCSWGILRYASDGAVFIKAMFGYDLTGSLTGPLEGHAGNFLFYVKNELLRSPVAFACVLMIIPIFAWNRKGFLNNKRRYALFLSALLPFVMFSVVRTKLIWYVYLCYPPLIVFASDCMEELVSNYNMRKTRIIIAIAVVLCLGTTVFNANTIYTLEAQDKVLTAIQDMLEKNSQYTGETIYQNYVDPETQLLHKKWRPSALFTFELHSSLRPKDGNADEWRKDSKALLFVSINGLKKLKNYRIKNSSGEYCIIEHARSNEI